MYILSPLVSNRLLNSLDKYVLPPVEYFQLNFQERVNLRELIDVESKYVTASGIWTTDHIQGDSFGTRPNKMQISQRLMNKIPTRCSKSSLLDLLHLVGILFINPRCTETRNSKSQRLFIRFWTCIYDYIPCFMRSMSILKEMLEMFIYSSHICMFKI
jgi:hypothetical protein